MFVKVVELMSDHFNFKEPFYIDTNKIEVVIPTKQTVYMISGDKYRLDISSYERLVKTLGIEVN